MKQVERMERSRALTFFKELGMPLEGELVDIISHRQVRCKYQECIWSLHKLLLKV